MIRIRPYKASDVNTILSWCQDEKVFYQWTAGILVKERIEGGANEKAALIFR